MEKKDLSVIIATFQSDVKIHSCLKSISNDIRIIVVENSNNKKFKLEIESKYKNVECILAGANKGYSVANNIGLKKVNTKYALVLNPDTKLEEKTIENFLVSAKNYPDFWLMGPASNIKNSEKNSDIRIKEVENLKGYAIFFNLKKFQNKFFDENYFLYFEEIDLCRNVKNRDGKILLDLDIQIFHEGASSVHRINKEYLELNRNWHWMWSTFYYHKKYNGFVKALLIVFPKLSTAVLKTIFYQLIMNKKKRNIYLYRLNGLVNSILGNKSWHRPTLD